MTKTRYIFSDGTGPDKKLEDATIEFDLGFYHQLIYEDLGPKNNIDLYVIVALSKHQSIIENAVKDNKQIMKDKNLSFEYLIKPFRNELGFYERVQLDKSHIEKTREKLLKKKAKIEKEGVYYAMFYWEVATQELDDNNVKLKNMNTHLNILDP